MMLENNENKQKEVGHLKQTHDIERPWVRIPAPELYPLLLFEKTKSKWDETEDGPF